MKPDSRVKTSLDEFGKICGRRGTLSLLLEREGGLPILLRMLIQSTSARGAAIYIWDKEIEEYLPMEGSIKGIGRSLSLLLRRQLDSLGDRRIKLRLSGPEAGSAGGGSLILCPMHSENKKIGALALLDPSTDAVRKRLGFLKEIARLSISLARFHARSKEVERQSNEVFRHKQRLDHILAKQEKQQFSLEAVNLDLAETMTELHRSLSLQEATIEAATDGIIVVDLSGNIITYNRKFLEMLRIPDSVIAQRRRDAILSCVCNQIKDAPSLFLARVDEIFSRPDSESHDVLEFKDGRIFERYTTPQRIDGISVGRVVAFRDVTERRKMEAQLRQSEKLSAVGQLAAGVAHEINNPLGVILGFAQSLSRRLVENDPMSLPVKSIEREAMRCKNLIQNLLTFAGQDRIAIEELDLNETVTNTLSVIEAQARFKSVEVFKELGDVKPLLGDKNQLQQVVVNLCNNAIDAMPNGGKITVRTRSDATGGRWAVLEVEDNGSGIPEEIQDKIFNPFFTTKEVGKGTGLGLSLVYETVQRHKGTIKLRSKAGHGATFTVFLPSRDSKIENIHGKT